MKTKGKFNINVLYLTFTIIFSAFTLKNYSMQPRQRHINPHVINPIVSSFIRAVMTNDESLLETTIRKNACTLSLWASQYDNMPMLQLILKHGGQECFNAIDETGNTPLIYACKNDSLEMVKMLLNNGAQRRINAKNIDMKTALDYALENKAEKITALLVENKAISVIENQKRASQLLNICEYGTLENLKSFFSIYQTQAQEVVNERDEKGRTPLLIACHRNKAKTVQFLLENGAKKSVNMKNMSRETALSMACYRANIKIAQLLLENGAQKTLNTTFQNNLTGGRNGNTPLSIAFQYGDQEMMKLLLANGANIPYQITSKIGNQRATGLIQLVTSYNQSKDKIQFIKNQSNRETAAWLTKRLLLDSMNLIMNNGKNIESTLLAVIYNNFSETFLKKLLGVDVLRPEGRNITEEDIWKYAERIIKKYKSFPIEDKQRYEFSKNLQPNQKFLDVTIRCSDDDNTTSLENRIRHQCQYCKKVFLRKTYLNDHIHNRSCRQRLSPYSFASRFFLGKRKRAERLCENKRQKHE